MFNLGMGEITVILVLALIFIGPKKLPDLAAGLGKLIKDIRKATSDVKNEIALDDTFRKPFEELRDAVTLHPDELKRRDQWAKEREEAAKRAAEEAAKYAAESANGLQGPPDGLADDVKLDDAAKAALMKGEVVQPVVAKPEAVKPEESARTFAPKLPVPNGPNATIVQPTPPRGATLDDIPTPPPETTAKPPAPPMPSLFGSVAPPAGTVSRPDTLRGVKPAVTAGTLPAAPANGESNPNSTQILREEDLIPSPSSGTPPPPPHLPGLRPAGAPRPGVAPPPPIAKSDTKPGTKSDTTSDKKKS